MHGANQKRRKNVANWRENCVADSDVGGVGCVVQNVADNRARKRKEWKFGDTEEKHVVGAGQSFGQRLSWCVTFGGRGMSAEPKVEFSLENYIYKLTGFQLE